MKKRSKIKAFLTTLMIAALLFGCSASRDGNSADYAVRETGAAKEEAGSYEIAKSAGEDIGSISSIITNSPNAKLIREASVSMEVTDIRVGIESINKKVSETSGYIETSNVDFGTGDVQYQRSYAEIIVRVPSESYAKFLDGLSEFGNVNNISESTRDVTLEYSDVESHKEALKVEESRLLELLKSAQTIDEIITIEGRLSSVRYELGSYESQLKVFDNQVDYSKFTINMYSVKEYTPKDSSALARMRTGIVSNARGVLVGIRELFIFIIINIPTIVLLALAVLVCRLLFKKIRSKVKLKKDKNSEGAAEEEKK